MKNKVKTRDVPCNFNSQFITANPFVQSDCCVSWSAGNLQGSLLLFLSLDVGRYTQMSKMLKKYGILGPAGIGVKWKY